MAAELTIEEKLRHLFKLQQIDSELKQIDILKGELPMEVQDLEDEIAGLETRINKFNLTIEDFQTDISNHNANIKESESLIERYKEQLNDVKNNREYEALTKEVELQELQIQLSNKKIGQVKEKIEQKRDTLAATDERRVKKAEALEAKKVELTAIISKTEADEEKLNKKIVRARKKIDDRLLTAYDRMRQTFRNGLGVVQIERNSCGGCFNRIPPQRQMEISHRNKIIACEHCGRILVDNYILTEGPVPLIVEEEPKKKRRTRRSTKDA